MVVELRVTEIELLESITLKPRIWTLPVLWNLKAKYMELCVALKLLIKTVGV